MTRTGPAARRGKQERRRSERAGNEPSHDRFRQRCRGRGRAHRHAVRRRHDGVALLGAADRRWCCCMAVRLVDKVGPQRTAAIAALHGDRAGPARSGDSAIPPEPWTATGFAEIIVAGLDIVLRRIDLPEQEKLHLAGFSFGGVIGGSVAAQRGQAARVHGRRLERAWAGALAHTAAARAGGR